MARKRNPRVDEQAARVEDLLRGLETRGEVPPGTGGIEEDDEEQGR